jgi:hypothetical protein
MVTMQRVPPVTLGTSSRPPSLKTSCRAIVRGIVAKATVGSYGDAAIVDGELPGLLRGREGYGDPAVAGRGERPAPPPLAVLHTAPIASPADAVRAAILQELSPDRNGDQISTLPHLDYP